MADTVNSAVYEDLHTSDWHVPETAMYHVHSHSASWPLQKSSCQISTNASILFDVQVYKGVQNFLNIKYFEKL